MSYPKQKTESYRATGGMNTKASQYITDDTEFLNLQNVDFRTVGALSSFAGSTLYSLPGQASTSVITGLQDFYYSVVTGYTLYNPFGVSYPGFTIAITGQTTGVLSTDANRVCDITARTFSSVYDYVVPGNENQTSFAYLNYQFGANGGDFWTRAYGSTGGSFWQYSLGKPIGSPIVALSNTNNGLSGFLTFYFSLARQDGFLGPSRAYTVAVAGETLVRLTRYPGYPNLSVNGGLSVGSFGLSGIAAWVQLNQNAPMQLVSLLGLTSGLGSGVTVGFNFTNGTGGWTTAQVLPEDFQGTYLYGAGATQGSDGAGYINQSNSQPQCIETFYNQLFVAIGSRIHYSNIGEPEKSSYDNFFDVALENPDDITMLRAFFTQLVIAKPGQVYALSGTGPSTFNLSLVSDEYGCLNKNAAVVWNQTFWFLDKKGIMEFNGANVIPTSNKMEDIFNRMNVDAAARTATMTHVKDRNEVWCAIPIDGSAVNNAIVVYDYLSNAWTVRTSPSGAVSALALVDRGNNKQTVYYGTTSGLVGTFGSSFIGDNGSQFTSVIKSRFIAPLGDSTTNLFRRLFIDATVPAGASFPFLINFYADHGATIAYQTTMVLTSFQNRIDFGVSAKSLAVEFIYSGSQFLEFNGFTIESRFQRAV